MKKKIQIAAGFAIAAFLVWFLFKDTNWDEVGKAIKEIHWGWFALAHVPLLMSFIFRIVRWKYIVNSVTPTSFRNLASATQIGFLGNMVLPARAGEGVRALVLTRHTKVPFSKTFAFVALDRVTDLFGLIAIMLVAIFAYRPELAVTIPGATFGLSEDIVFSPTTYQTGAYGMGFVLFGIIAVFVLLYAQKAFILKVVQAVVGVVSESLSNLGVRLLTQFAEGLDVFKSPRDMAMAIVFSLATWMMPVLFFMCTLKAFGIDAPWYTAFVMQSILSVFIAVPGAPGFVGQFHVPVVITLVMIVSGINIDQAKAFAIINHLAQLPPIILSGGYFLFKDGFQLTSLAHEGEEKVHEEGLHEIGAAEENEKDSVE
jgi:glycosyltransferase 2 family protein